MNTRHARWTRWIGLLALLLVINTAVMVTTTQLFAHAQSQGEIGRERPTLPPTYMPLTTVPEATIRAALTPTPPVATRTPTRDIPRTTPTRYAAAPATPIPQPTSVPPLPPAHAVNKPAGAMPRTGQMAEPDTSIILGGIACVLLTGGIVLLLMLARNQQK